MQMKHKMFGLVDVCPLEDVKYDEWVDQKDWRVYLWA